MLSDGERGVGGSPPLKFWLLKSDKEYGGIEFVDHNGQGSPVAV